MINKLKKLSKDKIGKFVLIVKYHGKIVSVLIVFGIISDVFLLKGTSDLRLFGVLGLYIINIWVFKLKSKITFLLCLFLLIAMYISFLISGTSDITEKIAVWFVLFLTVGIIQQWNEIS